MEVLGLARWQIVMAGFVWAAISLLAAHHYLRPPALPPRRPGLSLDGEPDWPRPERSDHDTAVGRICLGLAAAGALLGLVALALG